MALRSGCGVPRRGPGSCTEQARHDGAAESAPGVVDLSADGCLEHHDPRFLLLAFFAHVCLLHPFIGCKVGRDARGTGGSLRHGSAGVVAQGFRSTGLSMAGLRCVVQATRQHGGAATGGADRATAKDHFVLPRPTPRNNLSWPVKPASWRQGSSGPPSGRVVRRGYPRGAIHREGDAGSMIESLADGGHALVSAMAFLVAPANLHPLSAPLHPSAPPGAHFRRSSPI